MRDYCEYTKKNTHNFESTCELTNVTQIFQGAQAHSKLLVIIIEEISIHNVYSGHNLTKQKLILS